MSAKGKLGIFDSGLGGLYIARAIHQLFPDMDKLYLGDTLNLPYGSRSEEAIYQASKNCMEALFSMGCELIIVACNTASASALRRLQEQYLPENYPNKRILGVVVPTIEEALERDIKRFGVIGTNYTIASGIYLTELKKIDPDIEIYEKATPLLVPLIENQGDKYLDAVLDDYFAFMREAGLDTLLLGCTHYIHLKDRIRERHGYTVISQDEIIPSKLSSYLNNHSEITDNISLNGFFDFYVSDLTGAYQKSAAALFGKDIQVQLLEGVHDG